VTIYATSDDYTTYIGGSAPANIVALLRSASRLVADELFAVVYPVDADGAPTLAKDITATLEATCTQAAAWAALGIDPLAGGVVTAKVVASKNLDGGGVAYAGASDAAAARAYAVDHLVPDAWRILNQAGLTTTRVWISG
jgi:hypothetical protein